MGQLDIFSTGPQPKKIYIWIYDVCESPEAYAGYQLKKTEYIDAFQIYIFRLSIYLSPKSGFYIYKYLLDTFSQLSNRHLTFHLLKTEIVIFLFPLDLVLLTDSLYCLLESTWPEQSKSLTPFPIHLIPSVTKSS